MNFVGFVNVIFNIGKYIYMRKPWTYHIQVYDDLYTGKSEKNYFIGLIVKDRYNERVQQKSSDSECRFKIRHHELLEDGFISCSSEHIGGDLHVFDCIMPDCEMDLSVDVYMADTKVSTSHNVIHVRYPPINPSKCEVKVNDAVYLSNDVIKTVAGKRNWIHVDLKDWYGNPARGRHVLTIPNDDYNSSRVSVITRDICEFELKSTVACHIQKTCRVKYEDRLGPSATLTEINYIVEPASASSYTITRCIPSGITPMEHIEETTTYAGQPAVLHISTQDKFRNTCNPNMSDCQFKIQCKLEDDFTCCSGHIDKEHVFTCIMPDCEMDLSIDVYRTDTKLSTLPRSVISVRYPPIDPSKCEVKVNHAVYLSNDVIKTVAGEENWIHVDLKDGYGNPARGRHVLRRTFPNDDYNSTQISVISRDTCEFELKDTIACHTQKTCKVLTKRENLKQSWTKLVEINYIVEPACPKAFTVTGYSNKPSDVESSKKSFENITYIAYVGHPTLLHVNMKDQFGNVCCQNASNFDGLNQLGGIKFIQKGTEEEVLGKWANSNGSYSIKAVFNVEGTWNLKSSLLQCPQETIQVKHPSLSIELSLVTFPNEISPTCIPTVAAGKSIQIAIFLLDCFGEPFHGKYGQNDPVKIKLLKERKRETSSLPAVVTSSSQDDATNDCIQRFITLKSAGIYTICISVSNIFSREYGFTGYTELKKTLKLVVQPECLSSLSPMHDGPLGTRQGDQTTMPLHGYDRWNNRISHPQLNCYKFSVKKGNDTTSVAVRILDGIIIRFIIDESGLHSLWFKRDDDDNPIKICDIDVSSARIVQFDEDQCKLYGMNLWCNCAASIIIGPDHANFHNVNRIIKLRYGIDAFLSNGDVNDNNGQTNITLRPAGSIDPLVYVGLVHNLFGLLMSGHHYRDQATRFEDLRIYYRDKHDDSEYHNNSRRTWGNLKRGYAKLMKESHERAKNNLFNFYNKERGMDTIDLHGLRAYRDSTTEEDGEAVEVLQCHVDQIEQQGDLDWLEIIVGAGHHSRDGIQIVERVVKRYLTRKRQPYSQYQRINKGSLLVTFRSYHGNEPCHGSYYCKRCGRSWNSETSWVGEYQLCNTCRSECLPFKQSNRAPNRPRSRRNTRSPGQEYAPHREICGKCIRLGRDCRR